MSEQRTSSNGAVVEAAAVVGGSTVVAVAMAEARGVVEREEAPAMAAGMEAAV